MLSLVALIVKAENDTIILLLMGNSFSELTDLFLKHIEDSSFVKGKSTFRQRPDIAPVDRLSQYDITIK